MEETLTVLPAPWQEYETDSGTKYYYNPDTQQTSWTRPSGDAPLRASIRGRPSTSAASPVAGGSDGARPSSAPGGGKASSIREYTTADGRRYQHDSETGETTWLDGASSPRSSPRGSTGASSKAAAPSPADSAKSVGGGGGEGSSAAGGSSTTGGAPCGSGKEVREPARELLDGSQMQDCLLQLQRLVHAGVGATDASLAQSAQLQSLKKEMLQAAKLTHKLQTELQELEKLISLHIHNRMEVQDKINNKRGLQQLDATKKDVPPLAGQVTPRTKMTARDRKRYETLLYLLRVHPSWLAAIVSQVPHDLQPQLVQFVIFVLYADMHDPEDDLLLLQLFGTALQTEVGASNDISTFMRHNSALTELLAKYNQREPGREALTAILSKPIAALQAEAGLSLEIEPLKVHKELVDKPGGAELPKATSAEEAAALPAVAAVIGERVAAMARQAAVFIDAITAPEIIAALPFGMRWIAKTIMQLARARFADASDEQIYTLVGGFVFLRYINPVVVAPESLKLISTAPSRQMRRNCVLLAKILQALSNNVAFGGKEQYMVPMNAFLEDNRPRIRQYFDRLVDVPDLSLREMRIEKYLRTLRTEAQQRFVAISLNELYFLHRLLLRFPDVLKHADAKQALEGLAPPPEGKLPKEDDEDLSVSLAGGVALSWEEVAEGPRRNSVAVGGGVGALVRTETLTGASHAAAGAASAAQAEAAAAAIAAAEEAGEFDIWKLAASSEAAKARRQLCRVLRALPLAPILGSNWDECFAGMRALMTTQQSRASSAMSELGTLERELHRLGLLGHEHGNHTWALVETARDEMQAAEFAASQVYKYQHSLQRLRAATAGLQDNKKVFESTLHQVRTQLTASSRTKRSGKDLHREKDAAAEGSSSGKEEQSAPTPGPFTFSYEKLAKRQVFASTPDEVAAALGAVAAIAAAEPDAKRRSKLWAKATFAIELVAPGEFAFSARLKKEQELWGAQFTLDEFLKQRFHGLQRMELDGVTVNIEALLDLINEKFVMGK